MSMTYSKRLALLAGVAAVAILAILVRLYDLQIVDSARWRDALAHRSNDLRDIDGARGRIRDADGDLLAADGPGFDLMVVTAGWVGKLNRCKVCANDVYLRPKDREHFKRCPKCKQPASEVLDNLKSSLDLDPLARLLKTTEEALIEKLGKFTKDADKRVKEELQATTTRMSDRRRENFKRQLRRDYGWQPRVFRRDVSFEVVREVTLHPERNPPFRIRESRTRRNFGGEAFAHLIGRMPDHVVRARGRAAGGKHRWEGQGTGLESAVDPELRGEPGSVRKAADPDRRGRLIVVDRQAPVAGLDVRLTIARRDQIAAQGALSGETGAFVVVNAETGAVLAMVTAPTFDPDRYGQVVREATSKDRDRALPSPLPFRAVAGIYPPGSTMKPFTGIAGLTAGILSPDDTIACNRLYVLGDRTMRNMTCMGTHGPIGLEGALVHSCNIYFQTIVERLIETGRESHFEAVARAFGFGEATGLEVEPSRIPNRTFRLHPGKGAALLSARIQAGIGQGRVTATPAQVARAYAGLATGYLPRLHLVAELGGTRTKVRRKRLDVSAGRLETVRRGLRAKTAHDVNLNHPVYARHRVATKTGTAQREGRITYTAWLAGFADAQHNRPAIAFAMVIEDTDLYGGQACGGRVAEFLAEFYGSESE